MRVIHSLIPILLLSAALMGCTVRYGLNGDTYRDRDVTYQIVEPGQDWKKVNIRDADIAYLNTKDDATLLYNSRCKPRNDVPLEALSWHLLIGMTDQSVVSSEKIPFADREALVQTVNAKVDGVARTIQLLVLKKDDCIFDIVLACDPQSFASHEQLFKDIVAHYTAQVHLRE